jgi:hypothetical protein
MCTLMHILLSFSCLHAQPCRYPPPQRHSAAQLAVQPASPGMSSPRAQRQCEPADPPPICPRHTWLPVPRAVHMIPFACLPGSLILHLPHILAHLLLASLWPDGGQEEQRT